MPIFQDSTVIQDLKDFIENTISMSEKRLGKVIDEKLESKLTERLTPIEAKIDNIELKIDELSSDVALAISTSNESTDSKLHNHEKRITRLELRTA